MDYDNFLFFTATGRQDQTSTLAPGNNSYFYPSFSFAGVFSDKIKLPSWWSYGKIRASWAEIGKDYDPYSLNVYYGSYVLSSTGQVLWTRNDAKGDATLRPEKTRTLEIGTELKFLKNRLGLDLSWYKLNSRDQIIPVAISPTTGFTSTIINAGEIENKGIEITLNAVPIKNKDFSWDINLNYTANRNKVLSIREDLTEIVVASQFGYGGSSVTMKYVPGSAVGNLYGTSYLRYYAGGKPDDGVSVQSNLPIVITATGSNAGFPTRDATQRILGNAQPKWIGGIVNSLRYKNFGLTFQFDTQQGQYKYNQLGNFMAAFGIAKYTEDRDDAQTYAGVLPDGTQNTQVVYSGQGIKDGRNYGNGYYRNVYRGVSENFVEDASWVRLRNLTFSYNLPSSILGKTFIKGATVSFTGNNLWLSTDFTGYDPESSSFSSGSNATGFSGFTYPAMRSFLFSVNVNL